MVVVGCSSDAVGHPLFGAGMGADELPRRRGASPMLRPSTRAAEYLVWRIADGLGTL
jgi:hypothetical protein